MKTIATYSICTLVSALALAQGQLATLSGVITDPDGGAVPTVPIRAMDAAGKMYEAVTSSSGAYTLERLPAGTYQVVVPQVGFTLDKFERKDVVVRAGEAGHLDIRMSWAGNLGTPGDDPSIFLRTKYSGTSGPAPRTREGKPDLSGLWNGNDDSDPHDADVLPWAAALSKERRETKFIESPSTHCLPSSVPPMGPLLWKIVQTPALLVMLFEDLPGVRQIYLDGRPHPQDPNPTWMGHSVGKWEGDTLVVDTVGFNDKSWLDSYPHTESLHVIERYRRTDLAHLDVQITMEDPGTFVKPWVVHAVWNLAPGEEMLEYVCTENNRDTPHLVGK
jgi:hypothetical protein